MTPHETLNVGIDLIVRARMGGQHEVCPHASQEFAAKTRGPHESLHRLRHRIVDELTRATSHGSLPVAVVCVLLIVYPALTEANKTDTYDPGRGFTPDIEQVQDCIEISLS